MYGTIIFRQLWRIEYKRIFVYHGIITPVYIALITPACNDFLREWKALQLRALTDQEENRSLRHFI